MTYNLMTVVSILLFLGSCADYTVSALVANTSGAFFVALSTTFGLEGGNAPSPKT